MKKIFSLCQRHGLPRVIIPFAALLMVAGFYSCKDNPVVPPIEEPFELDSARFDWDIDTLTGFGITENCIYAEDTTNIFLVNTFENYLLNIKDGEKIFYHFSGFYPQCINGKDKEIYIGGSIRNNSGKFIPHIKKWTNGSFQDIYIPECDTCSNDYVKYLYVSQSEVWVMTVLYFVKYSSNQFNFYQIPYEDTEWLRGVRILEDNSNSNSLKAYAWDIRIEGNVGIKGDSLFEYSFIFEFKNNDWEKIWQNTWYPDNRLILGMDEMNNNIIANRHNRIYEFDGIKFNNVATINIDNYLDMGPELKGNSYHDILFRGNLANGMGVIVMHWNGLNLSYEFTPSQLSFSDTFYKIDENTFWYISNQYKENIILIFKGKRKT